MNLQNAIQIDLKPALFHMLFLMTWHKFYLYMSILAHYLYLLIVILYMVLYIYIAGCILSF